LTKHQELIAAETLAVTLIINPATGGEFSVGEDGRMAIGIEKAV
jgi:hypothetical protein